MDSIELAKYYNELIAASQAEYIAMLGIDVLEDPALRAYIREDMRRTYQWSQYNRLVVHAQTLKHAFIPARHDVITTIFKAAYDGVSTIYACLYSISSGGIQHISYCCGPTYRSQDGEYRPRYLPWYQYAQIRQMYAEPYLAACEREILSRLASGLELSVRIYYPDIPGEDRRTHEDEINNSRYAIHFLAMCLLCDGRNIHFGILENHINPGYQHIISNLGYEAIYQAYFRDSISIPPIAELITYHLSRVYNNIADDETALSRPQYGQKIIPLTRACRENPGKITSPVWREIYLSERLSDLALNFISPSFPFVGYWHYIYDIAADLFDNESMIERFERSRIADNMLTQLDQVYRLGRDDSGVSGFAGISERVHAAMDYARSHLALESRAICVTSEYMGRTLRDIPTMAMSKVDKGLRDILDPEIFTKVVFELVYGLYCANIRCGIVHADLHLNNMTLSQLYITDIPVMRQAGVSNPHVLYILSATESYLLPTNGIFASYIDFSRAIIWDQSLEQMLTAVEYEQYINEQNSRILQVIRHYFPRVYKLYKTTLEAMVIGRPEYMIRMVSLADYFAIGTNLAAMFDQDPAFRELAISERCVGLVSDLARRAEAMLNTMVKTAIDGTIDEWPGIHLIRELFGNYRMYPARLADHPEIVDVFYARAKQEYSMSSPSRWGPLVSMELTDKYRKKYGIHDDDAALWQSKLDSLVEDDIRWKRER